MSQNIKVLIPICNVPEDTCVYRSTKGKMQYIVKRVSTNNGITNILLSDNNGKISSIVLEDSTEVVWETNLETLNKVYKNEKAN